MEQEKTTDKKRRDQNTPHLEALQNIDDPQAAVGIFESKEELGEGKEGDESDEELDPPEYILRAETGKSKMSD